MYQLLANIYIHNVKCEKKHNVQFEAEYQKLKQSSDSGTTVKWGSPAIPNIQEMAENTWCTLVMYSTFICVVDNNWHGQCTWHQILFMATGICL